VQLQGLEKNPLHTSILSLLVILECEIFDEMVIQTKCKNSESRDCGQNCLLFYRCTLYNYNDIIDCEDVLAL